MKKIRNIKPHQLSIYLIILILFAGCNLDEEIYTEVEGDSFGKTEEEVSALVGAAYSSYAGWIGGPWTANVISSDIGVVPTRGTDWADNGQWIRLHQHEFRAEDGYTNPAWTAMYTGINNVNRIIFQLETIGTDTALQTIKELRVLRAINYYVLMDMFGNVPLVTSFDNAEESPANNSRAEIYLFIISEIEEVINDLPTDALATYGKVNKWVAHALLAKLYLNSKVYVGTAEWQKAIDHSDAIIDSGSYSLATNFFDNFAGENQTSPENIFVFVYDEVFSPGNRIAINTLHYQNQQTYDLTRQPFNGFSSLEGFYDTFDDDDIRKEIFVSGPQFDRAGNPVIDAQAEANDPDGQAVNLTVAINAIDAALRQEGARIGKFEFETNGDPLNMNNDFPIFRYGDILLTKAEAELRLGNDATALMLVNMLRNRAGVPQFTSLTLEELLDERGRETAFEGYRRQDQIRFGTFNDAWQFHAPDPSPHVNLFPIPFAQLNANPNLKQNPGY